MHRFARAPRSIPSHWRAWVCPRCETGGCGPRPVQCWWCGQPAVDIANNRLAMTAATITRVCRNTRVDVQRL